MLVFPIGPIDLLSSLSALKCPLPSITRSQDSYKHIGDDDDKECVVQIVQKLIGCGHNCYQP